MNPSTWAGVITAIGVFLTAIVGVIGAISNWRATSRVDNRVSNVEIGVHEVHDVVNSRLTALLERQEKLISALERAGVPVPPAIGDGA